MQILTNPRVVNQMSNLEIAARRGDPVAMDILSSKAYQFVEAIAADSGNGSTRTEQLADGQLVVSRVK